jgi:hypothetical protein
MKIHRNPATDLNPRNYQNKAVRFKIDGSFQWVWYDSIGRDYGPYPNKDYAETVGPIHSKKEEASLRRVV